MNTITVVAEFPTFWKEKVRLEFSCTPAEQPYSWKQIKEGKGNGKVTIPDGPGVYEVRLVYQDHNISLDKCIYVGSAPTILSRRIRDKLINGKSEKDHTYRQKILDEAAKEAEDLHLNIRVEELLQVRWIESKQPHWLELLLHVHNHPHFPDRNLLRLLHDLGLYLDVQINTKDAEDK